MTIYARPIDNESECAWLTLEWTVTNYAHSQPCPAYSIRCRLSGLNTAWFRWIDELEFKNPSDADEIKLLHTFYPEIIEHSFFNKLPFERERMNNHGMESK